MMIHTICLIDLAVLESLPGEDGAAGRVKLLVEIRPDRISEGGLFEAERIARQALGDRSPFYALLSEHVPASLVVRLQKALQEMDILRKLPGSLIWFQVLETAITIRNATKGHGALYFLKAEFVRTLATVVIEFTHRLSQSNGQIRCLVQGRPMPPDVPTWVYFAPIDQGVVDWMLDNPLNLCWAEKEARLFPWILYSPEYDTALFAGINSRGRYYKNYATGMYIVCPNRSGKELVG